MSIIYFLILIGVLIFVHELGHFLVAKAFNVKVLRFSLGFGPTAISVERGETEYVICWLPLGGYVKLMGDNPMEEVDDSEKDRALLQKPIWQRFLIILAGPVANLILPAMIFFGSGMLIEEVPAAAIGTVLSNSPAEESGFKAGDQILEINGEPTDYWLDLHDVISSSMEEELTVKVLRNDKEIELKVTPEKSTLSDPLGLSTKTVGRIGITSTTYQPVIGIQDPLSPAAVSGLKTFDRVLLIDGIKINIFSDIEKQIYKSQQHPVKIVVLRPTQFSFTTGDLFSQKVMEIQLTPVETQNNPLYSGIEPSEMYLYKIKENSPAAEAGLMPGDVITHLDGKPYNNFAVMAMAIQQKPDSEYSLEYIRQGVSYKTSLTPKQITYEGEFKEEVVRYLVGAYNLQRPGMPIMVKMPFSDRVVFAFSQSINRTGEYISMMLKGFLFLVQGKLSLKTVGGPIMIFDIAGRAGDEGISTFLGMMAIISINLGLVNLLPIPILDGGHLMLFTIEAIKRKPLSLRTRQIAAYIGLSLLFFLMVLAFKNDIERYWGDIVGWFS